MKILSFLSLSEGLYENLFKKKNKSIYCVVKYFAVCIPYLSYRELF